MISRHAVNHLLILGTISVPVVVEVPTASRMPDQRLAASSQTTMWHGVTGCVVCELRNDRCEPHQNQVPFVCSSYIYLSSEGQYMTGLDIGGPREIWLHRQPIQQRSRKTFPLGTVIQIQGETNEP
jgi:hypothetical protein